MDQPTLISVISSVSDSLLLAVLAYGWMAERKERQIGQDKFDRTLMALAGLKTVPDSADVVPSDKAADHEQRITKKLEAINRD